MAQVDVIITPGNGEISFYDNDLASQNQVKIHGEAQGFIYFCGDGSVVPGSGLTPATGSTNPNQTAQPWPGQGAYATASNALMVILDSITGTVTPGLSGYEMGSSTLPWRYWGTAANFSGAVTLAATSALILGNTGGANGAPLQFSASASSPSSLSAGQMWWDGTSLKFYTTAAKVVAWTDFSNISGTLTVPNGGTGVGTFTANGVLYGNTTSAIQVTAASGAVGAILQTTTSGGVPSYATTLPGAYTLSGSGTPLTVSSGLVAISTTGSTGGLLLGGDLALYRGATAELYVVGNATVGSATASNTLPTALTKRLSIINTTGIVGAQLAVVDGTLNPRVELFLDGSTALYGFDGTYSNTNAPQFVIRQLGVEQLRLTNGGQLQLPLVNITTTSTAAFVIQNTTASTSGVPAQQSASMDFIGHVWNTTTPADNTARFRNELQVTTGATPSSTLVWKASIDTGTPSYVNKMTLTSGGLLTISNGITITAGTFTIGSFTFAISSNSTLSTNSQSLIMNASIGNFTIGAGTGTSATQHNFVQSGTTQYVLESATAPTALGDMYYASTTSYATMTKLSIGVRGAVLVASTATPTPTWLSPSATAGVPLISNGTGADLTFGTASVAGGGTGATTFTANGVLYGNTTSAIQVTAASGAIGAILQTTTSGGVPSYATTLPGAYTLSNTGNALIVSSSTGKVGIGTASPASALHIANGNILVDPNNAVTASAIFAFYSAGASHNFGSWRNNNQINMLPSGRIMNRNPDLLDGLTGYAVYDNGASGTVSTTVITDTTSPAPTGTSIQIAYTGASGASPGLGGIRISITGSNTAVNSYQYRAGNRMIWVIRANIPVGYTLNAGSNSLGTGGTSSWLTPTAGTGAWAEYVLEQSSFNDASGAQGYLYVSGTLAAISWTLGAWYMIDVDNSVSTRNTPDLNIGYYMGANLNYGDLLNTGNGYLATTPSKNIGLGTTSPGQKLDIGYGHFRFTTLTAPTAPTVATGAAGVLTGNYYYMVTFVTVSGETSAGTASAVVAPSSQQVSLTAIPTDTTGNATSRKIYRTLTGGVNTGPFFLVTTIADNTTTTYTDNIADGSLTGTDATNQPNTTAARFYLGSIKAGFLGTLSTAFGYNSLSSQTTGFSNSAYGNQALASLTSGSTNVAVGPSALNALVSGGANTAVGYGSGQNATGSNGSYFGLNAGRGVIAGGANTMLGFQAGYGPNGVTANATTSGQNNTFVGFASGQATSTQISNSIAIGINSIVTGSNQANIGGIGSTYAVNLGLANSNPAQRLDIGYGHLRFTQLAAPTAPTTAVGAAGVLTGNYYYFVTFVTSAGETSPGTISAVVAPSSQQVSLTAIQTDTLGFATSRKIYRTATGGVTTGPFYLLTTIADNTTTTFTDNTADGSLGTTDFINKENTTAGYFYLGSNIVGWFGNTNLVFGQSSFYTTNSGLNNTGFGRGVLNANTTGIRNTAVGFNALAANTTGGFNTAIGYATLATNTTGAQNTALGQKALTANLTGTNNAGLSYQSLQANISGGQNTGVGSGSGFSVSYSNYVTALGYNADLLIPGTFSAAITAGSNLGIGAYYYLVTFVINSTETAPNINNINVTTTSGNQAVNLSGLPLYTGSYTATRKIYRTKVGGSVGATFYLLATIADNTTTVYADTVADTSLVTAYNTVLGSNSVIIGGSSQALYGKQLVIGSSSAPLSEGYLGNGVYAASPQAFTLHATGGLGTDIAGANFIIAPGQGTGAGVGGYFSVQTATAGSSGAVFNTLTERFRIDSTGLTSVKGTFNAGSAAQMTIDASGNIGTSGGYTQTGSTANTLSGATTFSAASTALTVNNNATFSGLVGVGGASVSAQQLTIATTAIGNVGIYINAIASQTANLQNWAVNGTIVANLNASGNFAANTTITINNTASGNPVSFTSSALVSASQAYILPTNVPSGAGQYLTCTSSAPYQLAWAIPSAGSATVSMGSTVASGVDTYILYITNVGTPTLSQDAGLAYNYGNQALSLAGTVSGAANIVVQKSAIATTSTPGAQIQNNTASTGGATQQQSPGLDFIGHVWNSSGTPADNYARLRQELQVTSGGTPTSLLVWKTSIDTGTASFSNVMTLTNAGLLTVANGLTVTTGAFTLGSFTLALSSSATLNLNSQTLAMSASIGNFTIGSGVGTSSTQHNFVQSGTTQYVLESATAPTALGDMYYASTSSYATMTKLGIGVRGARLVASGASPIPTWLAPSATAGVTVVSGGTGADLAYGTVVVAGGGTGQASFASTNSLIVSGSSSTGAFTTVTGASGLLYGTAANTAPTFVTSVGVLITFAAGLTITGAKTTTAAATTGYASANIPSGTTPTSPVSGDIWYDGTNLKFANGTNTVSLTTGTTWSVIAGTSATMAPANGYISNNAGLVTLTLPTTAAVGTEIRVAGYGAGGWKIAQNASQQIQFGIVNTTSGTGGYLQSVQPSDGVHLVCVVANTNWIVVSSQGNITVN